MPITVTLSDDLAARLQTAANDMGRPLDWLVEGLLEDLLIDVEFDHGFPVLRLPRDAPPLTTEDVNRLLHGEDPPPRQRRKRRRAK
jgi:hypothetical protein